MLSKPKTRIAIAAHIASLLSEALDHGSSLCDESLGATIRVAEVKSRRDVVDVVVDVFGDSDLYETHEFRIQIHNQLGLDVIGDDGED